MPDEKPIQDVRSDPAGLNPYENMQDIIQPTEMGEIFRSLNEDELDPITRMTTIDTRTRLTPIEARSVHAMDSLVGLQVMPSACLSITRQKKRLNISLGGLGRREMVETAVGKREHDRGAEPVTTGFFDRFKK